MGYQTESIELGTILRVVRDELRKQYNWSKDHCRVSGNGEPLPSSPEYFVGIIDSGTDGGTIDAYRIEERYRLNVWVWRRIGQYQEDRVENVLLDEDIHLGNIELPSGLERQVKRFIHFNYDLMNAINAVAGSGTAESGSGLQHPFVYQGSSSTQVGVPAGQDNAWAGRQLRFGGALLINCIG